MRGRVLSLLFLCSLGTVGTVHASVAKDILMREEGPPTKDMTIMREREWRKELQDMEEKVTGLHSTLAFAFDADETGSSKLYKANARVEATSGTYPEEIRFKASTGVLFKDGKLEEDVTSTLINYDYHFSPGHVWRPGVEGYAFGERFSDNFMSIQQRYEIGSGVKFEWHSKKLVGDGQAFVDHHGAFNKPLATTRASLDSVFYDLEPAVIETYAKLEVGVAFSIFTELERAQIESPTDTIVTAGTGLDTLRLVDPVRIPLSAEHQWRGVIRPSIYFRPNHLLTLSGHVYLKYPFSQPHRVGGRLDYRADTDLQVQLTVPHGKKGGVGVFWKWEEHYDNTPPRVPEAVVSTYSARNLILRQTVAESRHRAVHFGLEVKL